MLCFLELMAVNCSEAEMVITPEPPQGTKDTGLVVMVKLYTTLAYSHCERMIWLRKCHLWGVGKLKCFTWEKKKNAN